MTTVLERARDVGAATGAAMGAIVGGIVLGLPGAAAGAVVGTPIGVLAGRAVMAKQTKSPVLANPEVRRSRPRSAPRQNNPRYRKVNRTFPGFFHNKHRVPSGFGPFYSYPYYPYYFFPYTYYYQNTAEPTGVQPTWYLPYNCPAPLSDDCTRLSVTARWAASCFMPRYQTLRRVYGSDYVALASAIAREEAPWCPFPPQTGAAEEFERRVALAVAVLLNAQGETVPMPKPSPTPRPPQAGTILQPWMRALLTGWV